MPDEQLTLRLSAEDDLTPAINDAKSALAGLDGVVSRIAANIQRAFALNIGEISQKEFSKVRDEAVLTESAMMKVGQQMSLSLTDSVKTIQLTGAELAALGQKIHSAFAGIPGADTGKLRSMLGNPQDVAALDIYTAKLRQIAGIITEISSRRPPIDISAQGEKVFAAVQRDPSKAQTLSTQQMAALEAYNAKLREGAIEAEKATGVYRQLAIALKEIAEAEETASRKAGGGGGGYGRHGMRGFIPQAVEGFKAGGPMESLKAGMGAFGQGAMQMASWMIEWRILQGVLDAVAGSFQFLIDEYKLGVQISTILGSANKDVESSFHGIQMAALMTGQSIDDTSKRFVELYSHGFNPEQALKSVGMINDAFRKTGIDLTSVITNTEEFGSTVDDLRKYGTAMGHPEMLGVAQEMTKADNLKQIKEFNRQIDEQAEQRQFTVRTRNEERLRQDHYISVHQEMEDRHRISTQSMEDSHRAVNYEREDRHRALNQELQDRHRIASQSAEDTDRLHGRQVSAAQGIKGLLESAAGMPGANLPMAGLERAQGILRQELREGQVQLQKDLGISPDTSRQLMQTGLMAPSELLSEARAAKEEQRIQETRQREMESLQAQRAEAREDRAVTRAEELEMLNLVRGQRNEQREQGREQQRDELTKGREIQDEEFAMQTRNQKARTTFEGWFLQQRLNIIKIISDAELKALEVQQKAEDKLHGGKLPPTLGGPIFSPEVEEVTDILASRLLKPSLPGEPGGAASLKDAADSLQTHLESLGAPKTDELKIQTQSNTDVITKNVSTTHDNTESVRVNTDAVRVNTQVVGQAASRIAGSIPGGAGGWGGVPSIYEHSQSLWDMHVANLAQAGQTSLMISPAENFTAVNPKSSAAWRRQVGGGTDEQMRAAYARKGTAQGGGYAGPGFGEPSIAEQLDERIAARHAMQVPTEAPMFTQGQLTGTEAVRPSESKQQPTYWLAVVGKLTEISNKLDKISTSTQDTANAFK